MVEVGDEVEVLMEQTKSYKKEICGTASEEMRAFTERTDSLNEKENFAQSGDTKGKKSRARLGHTCGLGQREKLKTWPKSWCPHRSTSKKEIGERDTLEWDMRESEGYVWSLGFDREGAVR